MRNIIPKRALGVIGAPISHSISPIIHNAVIEHLRLECVYLPFHVLPDKLPEAVEGIKALGIAGVNVTIPHKERIIPYLDTLSDRARRIGSVNFVINRDGLLHGDSVDGLGFLRSVEELWGSPVGKRVLLLGAGGSAKAIAFALADVGCSLNIANRTLSRAQDLANSLSNVHAGAVKSVLSMSGAPFEQAVAQCDLLVNTTSVGMSPNVEDTPVPEYLLRKDLFVYDLIYNPPVTRLVREARMRGANASTGLGMLIHQAALSFEMWTGISPPISVMHKAAEEYFNLG